MNPDCLYTRIYKSVQSMKIQEKNVCVLNWKSQNDDSITYFHMYTESVIEKGMNMTPTYDIISNNLTTFVLHFVSTDASFTI